MLATLEKSIKIKYTTFIRPGFLAMNYSMILQELGKRNDPSKFVTGFDSDSWIGAYPQDQLCIESILSKENKLEMSDAHERRNVYIFLGETGGTREFIKIWNAKFAQTSPATTSPVFKVFIKINNLNQRKVIVRGETEYVDILKSSQFDEMYSIIKNSASLACNITCDEFRLLKGFLKSAKCNVVVNLSGFTNSFMGRTDIF